MALFTFVLEFDGGTYISQFRAPSARRAMAQYSSRIVRNRAVPTALRKGLANALSVEHPVAIEGMRNVWCCSASIGRKLALLNVVATAQTQSVNGLIAST